MEPGAASVGTSVLAANSVLEVLTPAALNELVALGRLVRFKAGATIFEKGSSGDCLYIVTTGRVDIKTVSPDGQEILLNILVPGDILGEIALLDGGERTAGASVVQVADLLRIDRDDFMPFLERQPQLSKRLIELLCQRLRWTSEIIENTIFLDIPRRLAKRLLSLVEEHGRPCDQGIELDLRLYQEALAEMLGATRESVSKSISLLVARRAITYKRGAITILDPTILGRLIAE